VKDLTKIDGVAVIERVKAKMKNIGLSGANGAEISSVDEVMLADERVVYQCVSPDDPDCGYWNVNPRSVTAHQRTHGRSGLRRQLKAANNELNELKAHRERVRANRQRGAQQAAETKKAQRLTIPAEVGHPMKGEDSLTNLEAASRRVVTAYNAMQEAADEFQRVFLGYMRLAATAAAPTPINPELIAKAEKWDKYIEFQEFVAGSSNGGTSSKTRVTRRRDGK
jgi:hypothetical protein